MVIRLHHCPQTRSMRTLWLLNELNVPFETVLHRFGKALRAPDFLEKSPAGRVPALEIDGDVMVETGAITEYLCERYPKAGLGRLPGKAERRDWLVWIHFAETISQHVAALTQQHVMLYEDAMRSAIVMKLEAARVGKCYEAIEQALDGQDWLLESGFSAADISVGQAVYMARHFTKIEPYEELLAWYERCAEREAFQASLPGQTGRLYDRAFYPAWPVEPGA